MTVLSVQSGCRRSSTAAPPRASSPSVSRVLPRPGLSALSSRQIPLSLCLPTFAMALPDHFLAGSLPSPPLHQCHAFAQAPPGPYLRSRNPDRRPATPTRGGSQSCSTRHPIPDPSQDSRRVPGGYAAIRPVLQTPGLRSAKFHAPCDRCCPSPASHRPRSSHVAADCVHPKRPIRSVRQCDRRLLSPEP